MATKFIFARDINGYNGFGLLFTDTAYSCTLTASTNTTLTVPSVSPPGGSSYEGIAQPILVAIFSYTSGNDVWVANNATASAPAGNTFAATPSELMTEGMARQVKGGDVLNFFTTGTSVKVSVLFYWIGQ